MAYYLSKTLSMSFATPVADKPKWRPSILLHPWKQSTIRRLNRLLLRLRQNWNE